MAETTFAPTTVIDTSKIIDPILQNQMQKIAFAKSQVENMQSGVASIAKSLGQIKMAGTQNDQLSMQQMMNKLRDDWTAANVKYQGNIPIQEQVKYQGALSQLNQMADLYAADKKEVDRYEKDFTKMFVDGNVSPESYERFREDLVARQSRPVWERQPLNYANYVDPKAKTENNSLTDLLVANKYQPDIDKKDGSTVLYDAKTSKNYFKELITSDPKAKADFEAVMQNKGWDAEKDMDKGLDLLVGMHRTQFRNTFNEKDDTDDSDSLAFTTQESFLNNWDTGVVVPGNREVAVSTRFPKNFMYKDGRADILAIESDGKEVYAVLDVKKRVPIDPKYPDMGSNTIIEREKVPYDSVSGVIKSMGKLGKQYDEEITKRFMSTGGPAQVKPNNKPNNNVTDLSSFFNEEN